MRFFSTLRSRAERPKIRRGFILPGFAEIYIKNAPAKTGALF
jgi:hypothetical protein